MLASLPNHLTSVQALVGLVCKAETILSALRRNGMYDAGHLGYLGYHLPNGLLTAFRAFCLL